MPRWARILVLYALSRVYSTALLAVLFRVATDAGWAFASHRDDPSFFTFSGSWDAWFYRSISLHGYPHELPTDAAGQVRPNAWAFLPLYPAVVRGVMTVTGLDFWVAGVLVSVLAGAGALLALDALLRPRVGGHAAWWALVLFCFGPLAFVLQVAYAESLFLLLTFAALVAMAARRYLIVLALGVLAAFTRPGALAIALALGIDLVIRWRGRHERPFPVGQRVALVVAGAGVSIAGLSWPFIADAVTGHPGAYLQTELSWWTGFVGTIDFVPLTPWFTMAGTWLGVLGYGLVVIVAGLFAWWLVRAARRGLGHIVIGFSASYALYLFAVFLPQQSLFRMTMPLAPLLGDPVLTRGAVRWWLLGAGIALQPVAVVLLWFLGYP
jgi:hypothetical protein